MVRFYIRLRPWGYSVRWRERGRLREKSLGTRSLRVARAKVAEWERSLTLAEAGVKAVPATEMWSVTELQSAYLVEARRTLRKSTFEARQRRLAQFTRTTGVRCVSEITPDFLNAYFAERLKEVKPRTVNRFRIALSALFTFGIRSGRLTRNPVRLVPPQREPREEIRHLSAGQVDGQLAALGTEPTIQSAVAVMIYAGLRRAEAMQLRVEDVDLGRGVIHVRERDGWAPKTGRNRVIPIIENLTTFVSRQKLASRNGIFHPSPLGKLWELGNFSKRLKKINREASLPWSCLDYRHTFGSILAQAGMSFGKIARLMGNSAAVVERHYAHLSPVEMAGEMGWAFRREPSRQVL